MTGLLDLTVLSGWLSDVLAKEIHDTFGKENYTHIYGHPPQIYLSHFLMVFTV